MYTFTFEELVSKYGEPILKYDIMNTFSSYSIEDDIAEKPYKVAVFNNLKNPLGITICATYNSVENSQWHVNAGDKWLVKMMLTDKNLVEILLSHLSKGEKKNEN